MNKQAITEIAEIVFIEIQQGLCCETWVNEKYMGDYFIRYN